jgi:lipopolysaccharide biosynthesis regulator YciM
MDRFDFPGEGGGQPNREQLLNMAIQAAKNNNVEGARVMFRKVLTEDKRNERAMIWMAKIAKTNEERVQWLNRVLQVNPDNDTARAALKKIQYKRSAQDNRTLLIFGMVAGVVLVLFIVIAAALLLFGN